MHTPLLRLMGAIQQCAAQQYRPVQAGHRQPRQILPDSCIQPSAQRNTPCPSSNPEWGQSAGIAARLALAWGAASSHHVLPTFMTQLLYLCFTGGRGQHPQQELC